jgi:hypothetical protein
VRLGTKFEGCRTGADVAAHGVPPHGIVRIP